MVATIRNLTSSSATSEYFQKDGGYYLRKGDDETDLRAKQEEHRNGSAWYGLRKPVAVRSLAWNRDVHAGQETVTSIPRERDQSPTDERSQPANR